MSDANRRTFLTFLGFAPASAVGAESMLEPPKKPGGLQVGQESSPERIAYSLRRLAEGVEDGSVMIERIDFSASLAPDEVVRHKMSISLVHTPKDA